MTTDKDLAVAREMLDAEIAAMTRTLAERDALCEQQTRTIHGIPALMRERDAEKARADAAEQELSDAWAATGVASTVRGLTTLADVASTWREERDAAEQMVCELRGVLRYYATRDFDSRGYSDSQLQAPADAALARTEPVAGRWVPVAEHADAVRAVISRQERIEALEAERDAAIAAKDAAEKMVCEMRACLERAQCQHAECSPVETHNGCNARAILARTEPVAGRWVSHDVHERVKETWRKRHAELAAERDAAHAAKEAAESREHALGVQVVALRERVALLSEGADILRDISDDARAVPAGFEDYYLIEKATIDIVVGCFLEKVDAVPGDALATCKPGLQVGVEASGVDVERVSVPTYDGEDEVTP
jgi:hypothetical protein